MKNIAYTIIYAAYEILIRRIKIEKQNYYKRKLSVNNLTIHFPIFINDLRNLKIGENCAIAPFVQMWANDLITIGANTIIAAHVQITTSTHDYNVKPYMSKRVDRPITIGENVWICGGVIILPGVIIGDNCVIGAGSVVTSDIPANSLAYGSPAKVVKALI